MGSKERRERERSDQRQRILDAALQIISKEGFAALSMRKLAERIEYSAASIYLYFDSREQIAQELSESGIQELANDLETATSGKTGVESLGAIGMAYVAFGLRQPEIYRLIFMGDSDYITAAFGKKQENSAGQRAYDALLAQAGQLQAGGLWQNATAVELAEMVWTTLHGIVSLHITCTEMRLTSPQRLVELATNMLSQRLATPALRTAPVARRKSRV